MKNREQSWRWVVGIVVAILLHGGLLYSVQSFQPVLLSDSSVQEIEQIEVSFLQEIEPPVTVAPPPVLEEISEPKREEEPERQETIVPSKKPEVRPTPAVKKVAKPPLKKPKKPVKKVAPSASPLVSQEAQIQSPPSPLRMSKPKYPKSLRSQGIEGEVALSVEVLPNGKVGQLAVRRGSGYPAFDQSALKAARYWKFRPAKNMLGQSVAKTVTLPVRFVIE